MAAPLTAEALKKELETLLDMCNRQLITKEEFAGMRQKTIAGYQPQPATLFASTQKRKCRSDEEREGGVTGEQAKPISEQEIGSRAPGIQSPLANEGGKASISGGVGRKRAQCPHGRRKDTCKDCGGSGICEHGKRRYRCKDCGGSQVCPHQRRKDECGDCKAAANERSRAANAKVVSSYK